jgi:nucleolar MIF4G domain-containing protein 1
MSRKEARKQDRVVRKQHKADFFSAGITGNKRLAEEDHVESPKRKKAKYNDVNSTVSARSVAQSSQPSNHAEKPIRPLALGAKSSEQKVRPARQHLAETKRPRITMPRTQKEEEEDSYIKYLETKLKHDRSGFKGDGLDGKWMSTADAIWKAGLMNSSDLLDLTDSFAYSQPQVR